MYTFIQTHYAHIFGKVLGVLSNLFFVKGKSWHVLTSSEANELHFDPLPYFGAVVIATHQASANRIPAVLQDVEMEKLISSQKFVNMIFLSFPCPLFYFWSKTCSIDRVISWSLISYHLFSCKGCWYLDFSSLPKVFHQLWLDIRPSTFQTIFVANNQTKSFKVFFYSNLDEVQQKSYFNKKVAKMTPSFLNESSRVSHHRLSW